MSDSEPIDYDALIEANPMVNRGQLARAHELVEKLRESGLTPPPSYRIDSPYERGPIERAPAPPR